MEIDATRLHTNFVLFVHFVVKNMIPRAAQP